MACSMNGPVAKSPLALLDLIGPPSREMTPASLPVATSIYQGQTLPPRLVLPSSGKNNELV